MLRIGEFARLCGVSVRTLRFYEERGLLRPAHIDAENGYRSYRIDQVPRVHQILAFRDLGLSLEQIAALLATGRFSVQSFRTMLDAKRAELEAHVRTEQARLKRVEARIQQIEGGKMPEFTVVIKAVEPLLVASQRQVVPTLEALTTALPPMFEALYHYVFANGTSVAGPVMEVWYHSEAFDGKNIDVEACVPIADPIPANESIAVRTLDAVPTMASTIYNGPYNGLGVAYQALYRWVGDNQYRICAPDRSVVLQHRRGGDPNDNEVEVQFPVERIAA